MGDRRLVVVDDEPEFAEYVRKVAAGLGFEVQVTTGAAAFKKAYDAFDPGVIVLDVVMPETDGIEVDAVAGRARVLGASRRRHRLHAEVRLSGEEVGRGQGHAIGHQPDQAGEAGRVARGASPRITATP